MTELPNPIKLLQELMALRCLTMEQTPGEKTLARLMELIEDLCWFRFYGFRNEQLETIVKADPAIQQIYDRIAAHEQGDASPITRHQFRTKGL